MSGRAIAVLLCGMAIVAVACKTAQPGPAKAPVAAVAPVAPTEDVAAKNFLQLPDPQAGSLIKPEHFVRDWLVLGPFTYETGKVGGDEDQGSAKIAFVKDEANLIPKEGAEVEGKKWVRYKIAEDPTPDKINLDAFYNGIDYCAAYLGCHVYAPRDLDNLHLLIGSDDYDTVWINGKQVHFYGERRRAPMADEDTVKGVSLKKGKNVVVVKLVDVVIQWALYFRFTDDKGLPMRVADKP